uniref:Secreted protein n=1 Tax=Anolis carolinensis TaxID=28377 RepID=A0A803SYN2_ANOCA
MIFFPFSLLLLPSRFSSGAFLWLQHSEDDGCILICCQQCQAAPKTFNAVIRYINRNIVSRMRAFKSTVFCLLYPVLVIAQERY